MAAYVSQETLRRATAYHGRKLIELYRANRQAEDDYREQLVRGNIAASWEWLDAAVNTRQELYNYISAMANGQL